MELYKRMPQVPEATYKSEGTFNNALYFLVKNGWLQEDETALLSSMNPEYKALIVNVPQLDCITQMHTEALADEHANMVNLLKNRTR